MMAIVSVIKSDQSTEDQLVWKHPQTNIPYGSQIIVHESQRAFLVKSGRICDEFGPGGHTLTAENIPVLGALINLPFGGSTPFSAEVWFVNLTSKRDLRWGTPQPLQVFDKTLNVPLSIRAFGTWGVQISNPREFLVKIIGSRNGGDSEIVHRYFISEIVQKLSGAISSIIYDEGMGAINVIRHADRVAAATRAAISNEFQTYGMNIINFNIESMTIPPDEMSRLQDIFSKVLEVSKLSGTEVTENYKSIKLLDAIDASTAGPAGDGSIVGSVLAAGIGLGAVAPLMQGVGNLVQSQNQSASDNLQSVKQKLVELAEIKELGLLTDEEYGAIRNRILGSI